MGTPRLPRHYAICVHICWLLQLLTGFMTVAGNGLSISETVTFRRLAPLNYMNVLYVVKPASPCCRSNDIWDATWKNWLYLRCPDLWVTMKLTQTDQGTLDNRHPLIRGSPIPGSTKQKTRRLNLLHRVPNTFLRMTPL